MRPKGSGSGRKDKGRASLGMSQGKTGKRFWCPVKDCVSLPIQKVGQHLTKVHRLDQKAVTALLKKKCPPQAGLPTISFPDNRRAYGHCILYYRQQRER